MDIRSRVCYRCGRPVVRNGLCEECWEREQIPERVKVNEIRQCRSCGKTFHPHLRTFVDITPSSMVEELSGAPATEERGKVVVELRDRRQEIPIRRIMCLVCSRKSGSYHEAKIQLRDGLEFLVSFIPEDEIVRVDELKEGIDVLVLSKAAAKSFISLVKNKYSVKFSRKLVGERGGKRIYRDVYAVRKWKSQ